MCLVLKNACRKINHYEYDSEAAFIPLLAYDYFGSFLQIIAGKERGEVFTKQINKIHKLSLHEKSQSNMDEEESHSKLHI